MDSAHRSLIAIDISTTRPKTENFRVPDDSYFFRYSTCKLPMLLQGASRLPTARKPCRSPCGNLYRLPAQTPVTPDRILHALIIPVNRTCQRFREGRCDPLYSRGRTIAIEHNSGTLEKISLAAFLETRPPFALTNAAIFTVNLSLSVSSRRMAKRNTQRRLNEPLAVNHFQARSHTVFSRLVNATVSFLIA